MKYHGRASSPKGKDKMEPNLVALVALLIVVGLIIAGTRFSLYLFLMKAEGTRHYAQHVPASEERVSHHNEYAIESPLYYKTLNTSSSSARYARNSLMMVAFFLLLAIMATISIAAGLFH